MADQLQLSSRSREEESLRPGGAPPRRGYYIYVTEACNLRCTYCFVRQKVNHRHLSDQGASQVLSFIRRDAAELRDLYVHFFGGEPLIRSDTVEFLARELRLWSQAQGIKLRLGITTNGTLLNTTNCQMLQRYAIGVQLSLDGSRTGNNVHRQLMGGTQCGLRPAGAFDCVQIPNYISYFGGNRPNCRMTLTIHNLRYLSDSIRELYAIGFKSFSVIPDADCGDWTQDHLSRYELEMSKVFEYWTAHRDISINAIDQVIDRIVAKRPRRELCQVGRTIIGITVDGDIYPCHDFAGRYAADPTERGKFVLGNIASGYLTTREAISELGVGPMVRSGNGYDCERCWARWVCSRGCPYMNYARAGNVHTVKCDVLRHDPG